MNPPANWYPDPTGRHQQRYWDGDQWTEHIFTDGTQGVDPLDPPDPGPSADTTVADAVTEPAEAHDESRDEVDAPDAEAHVAQPADDAPAGGAAGKDAEVDHAADEDAPAAPAGDGLFSEARIGPQDAATSDVAHGDGPNLWMPASDEEPAASAASEEPAELATEVEADDVVGALDEVEQAQDAEADLPVAGGGLSDAFVLAPETASRLVAKRTRAPEDQDTEETPEPQATPGAIDAPPPTLHDEAPAAEMSAPAVPAASARDAEGGLGITGELVGGAFSEREEGGPVALQNTRMLRCAVSTGNTLVARQGTMVAYQGDVQFERQGAGGVGRALKRAATGEGLAMMRVDGTGDVFFADGAQHIFILQLDGGLGISVNGRNVLAFSASLAWDIERVKGANLLAGGLFNTTLTGTGWVALVSDGQPVVLRTHEAATFVDVNALVAWSGGLATRIVSTLSAKSLVGLGSGEAFQMAFEGSGIVIVQPSEGAIAAAVGG